MSKMNTMKPGKFLKTGEHPKAIMLRCGDWIEAAKDQMFQESEHGQAWELWQGLSDGRAQFIKRFPKSRVLMTNGSKRSVVVSR